MAMRLSGLMSGMDTESIIEQLVSAKKTKVDNTKKAQTKLEWKQDAWKSLNTKLKNLQSKYLSSMRFSDAYSKKTTRVSNSNAVSVITGENAVNGVQTLEIKRLAKTGYMTGSAIKGAGTDKLTALSKMSKLDGFESESGSINVTTGSTSVDIQIGKETTISNVLTQLKSAGLNANFDENNQRFFISSKESGAASDFSITASDEGGLKALEALGLRESITDKDIEILGKIKESVKNGFLTKDEIERLDVSATMKKYIADANAGADTSDKAKFAFDLIDKATVSGGATKINGQDAVIELNGAEFTSKNNTFAINGLTFTALDETKEGEKITVTTEQDTDGIYDMVKNFLKEYNAIINEMDKLYNAASAKGYEPLTTEEKDALSDSEIEEYEKKIKDALLRKDENLNSVSSAMKMVMSSGIEVKGKTMYLSDFGIDTLGYFEAADNEKYAYHIAGDPDDAATAGNADKFKSMIANNPETVVSFFTKLSQNLYDKMSDLSSSVQGYRSFGSFYDDKKMKSDYENYTTKIKEQEQKLNDYEDKWYKKFAAMETALSKMQSGANAVTSLLGGS